MLLSVEIKENETIDWYEPEMEILLLLLYCSKWIYGKFQILRCLLNRMIVSPMCLKTLNNPNVQNNQDNQKLHQYLQLI